MKERKIISCHNNTSLHSHIESVDLIDGDYELVPSDSLATAGVDLNCTNVAQDLGQAPEDSRFDSAQEGKPRCMIPLFSRYLHLTIHICCNNFICAFTYS